MSFSAKTENFNAGKTVVMGCKPEYTITVEIKAKRDIKNEIEGGTRLRDDFDDVSAPVLLVKNTPYLILIPYVAIRELANDILLSMPSIGEGSSYFFVFLGGGSV